jgi:hypothetical protein
MLHPRLAARHSDGHYHVFSPVLRKTIVLCRREWHLLVGLSGGTADGRMAGDEREAGHHDTADATGLGRQAQIYLRTCKYLALGLLIEETWLQGNALAALRVVPRTAKSAADLMHPLRRGHGVRIEDLFVAEREVELSDDFDRARFESLAEEYRRSPDVQKKILTMPLEVCRCPAGALALLAGTHFACIAHLMNLRLRVHLLQPAEFLARSVDLPTEFFGTMRDTMPYQSIFHRGEELVRGRRTALYERMRRIQPSDLQGRRVLDLGCNIGMNCYLAVEDGARAATGIDLPPLAAAATRLNAFYGMPCSFMAADLNQEVTALGDHDTVFIFALMGHLKSAEGVIKTIRNVNARVAYVETHCDLQPQGDLSGLLQSPIFRRIDFLGYNLDNVMRQTRTRAFYRCLVGR